MFYIILLAVISIILFLLRKRLISGLVVSAIFVGVLFFVIFLLDWYTAVDVRQYVDIGWYDDTIENPVKVGEDLITTTGGKVIELNAELKEQGSELDERFGVAQTGTGVWAGVQESNPDEPQGNQRLDELQGAYESKQAYEGQTTDESSSGNTNNPSTSTINGGSNQYTYEELSTVLGQLTISEEDRQLLKALSVHNTGTFEGEGITVTTTQQGVTITTK